MKKKPKVDKEEWEFVEAQFLFFKVGKTTPAKEFVTLRQYPIQLTLDSLNKKLLATKIGELDIIPKMPAYDIMIYI